MENAITTMNSATFGWDTQFVEAASSELLRNSAATANVVPLRLGGIWRGYRIDAKDIQEARRELWAELLSDD